MGYLNYMKKQKLIKKIKGPGVEIILLKTTGQRRHAVLHGLGDVK